MEYVAFRIHRDGKLEYSFAFNEEQKDEIRVSAFYGPLTERKWDYEQPYNDFHVGAYLPIGNVTLPTGWEKAKQGTLIGHKDDAVITTNEDGTTSYQITFSWREVDKDVLQEALIRVEHNHERDTEVALTEHAYGNVLALLCAATAVTVEHTTNNPHAAAQYQAVQDKLLEITQREHEEETGEQILPDGHPTLTLDELDQRAQAARRRGKIAYRVLGTKKQLLAEIKTSADVIALAEVPEGWEQTVDSVRQLQGLTDVYYDLGVHGKLDAGVVMTTALVLAGVLRDPSPTDEDEEGST